MTTEGQEREPDKAHGQTHAAGTVRNGTQSSDREVIDLHVRGDGSIGLEIGRHHADLKLVSVRRERRKRGERGLHVARRDGDSGENLAGEGKGRGEHCCVFERECLEEGKFGVVRILASSLSLSHSYMSTLRLFGE